MTGRYRQDTKLMQDAAAGLRPAQEAVLRRVRHRVHVVSSAVLGHREDAEDSTQATLIQVLRRASTFRGDSTIEAWATRIAAREAMRVAQERRLRAAEAVTEETAPAEHALPLSAELAVEVPKHIREYLGDLPEVLRSALVLRYVLGYTVLEIAEELATSPNTVKDRLTRARSQVRRAIRRELLAEKPQKVNHS